MITKDDTLFLKGKGKDADIKARVDQVKEKIKVFVLVSSAYKNNGYKSTSLTRN